MPTGRPTNLAHELHFSYLPFETFENARGQLNSKFTARRDVWFGSSPLSRRFLMRRSTKWDYHSQFSTSDLGDAFVGGERLRTRATSTHPPIIREQSGTVLVKARDCRFYLDGRSPCLVSCPSAQLMSIITESCFS